MDKKVALITGASSGIGRETAIYFASHGYKVYGVARRDFDIEGVSPVLGDITDKKVVKEIVDFVIKLEGKIDVLINNAGMGIAGAIETTDIELAEKQFKVNFFGTVNMTQEVLPHMRKQSSGMIINTSSVASVFPIPYQAFYSASKSALDTWAKALRLELKDFNIKVCNVLPGDIKTGFSASRERKVDSKSPYFIKESASISKMEQDEEKGLEPIVVAKKIYKVAQRKNPPYQVVAGGSYRFLCFIQRFLPTRFVMWVVSKLYKA